MSTLDDLKGILHDVADLVVGASHLHERIDSLSDEPAPTPAAAPGDVADLVVGASHLHERIDSLSDEPAPTPAAAPGADDREAEKAALRARLAELEESPAEGAATA